MDRFDIVEGHAVLEWDYNVGGILMERPSNQRRMQSTGVQLHRMKFKARPDLSYENLTDEGREVYLTNVLRWKLPIDEKLKQDIEAFFVPGFLAESGHPSFAVVHPTEKSST